MHFVVTLSYPPPQGVIRVPVVAVVVGIDATIEKLPMIFTAIIICLVTSKIVEPCHGWTSASKNINHLRQLKESSTFEEPDNQFGRMTYWDDEYKQSLIDNTDDKNTSSENYTTQLFSWYCG